VTLTSGTEYWFGNSGTTDAGQFGFEMTSTAPTGSQLYRLGIFPPTDQWRLSPVTLAFQLTAVPEPSTWAMMLLGFAGLGFLAYRKRPVDATA
jgi:PEP-CTERM motif